MWAQIDLANRSGLSIGTISAIESTGRVDNKSRATLMNLARALEVSYEQILKLADEHGALEGALEGDAPKPKLAKTSVPGHVTAALADSADWSNAKVESEARAAAGRRDWLRASALYMVLRERQPSEAAPKKAAKKRRQ